MNAVVAPPEALRDLTLAEVARWSSGGTPKAGTTEYYGGGIPWAVIGDLNDGVVTSTASTITEAGLSNSSAKVVPTGTLLVAMYGSIGKLGIAGIPMATNQAIACAVPNPGVDTQYLFHYLKSQRDDLLLAGKGGAQQNISQTVLKAWPIPVPPLDEQRRLAIWLDEIDGRRASIQDRLAAARAIVDRLRVAVLAAACSGRLTADWREAQDRSATRGCESSISEADPDLLGEIPDSWRAVSLGQLIERIEAGKSVRADGRRAEPDEWGVIKVSAMSWGSFLQHENKAVVDPALVNPRYEIHADDLLISRANTVDLVGATVHVLETRPRLLLSDKSLRLVPRDGVDKAWLNMAMGCPTSRSQLADLATGTSESMRNLSQPKILATTLALPPLPEQHEIVRRATAVLATVDRLGTAINRAEAQLLRASRGALAQAFRGDLVAEPVA